MERIVLILLLVTGLYACIKNEPARDDGYLNVKVVGEENDISWQYFTSSWEPGEGKLKMKGTGYQYKLCKLDLSNVRSLDSINISDLDQLYYEDGNFLPDTVSGEINITEINSTHIKGTLDAFFADRSKNEQVRVTGEFYSLSRE